MDFLARWVQKLANTNVVQRPLHSTTACLLYADDTAFFFKPTVQQCSVVKIILHGFQHTTGLAVNKSKSDLILVGVHDDEILQLKTVLDCRVADLPTTFLGLPLSDKKLPHTAYQQMISKMERRLSHWSASMLSLAGKLVLLNASLTSIPIYFMSVFLLPKWVIAKIDKIRRDFLWKGKLQDKSRLILVNWKKVCQPKSIGGLGVIDLKLFNQCLLSKWIWRWYSSQHCNWSSFLRINNLEPLSHLFGKISTVLPAFQANTLFNLGDGALVSFWHNNWGFGILQYQLPDLYSFSLNQTISLKDFPLQQPLLHFRNTVVSSSIAMLQLTEAIDLISMVTPLQQGQMDKITWKSSNSVFSTSSLYSFLTAGPVVMVNWIHLWQFRVPPRVKTFCWLFFNNKLATIDNLQKRGWLLPNMCCLCKKDAETAKHLAADCIYTARVWDHIFDKVHISNPKKSWNDRLTSCTKKQGEILAIAAFFIWRERCSKIFRDKLLLPQHVAADVLAEWSFFNPVT